MAVRGLTLDAGAFLAAEQDSRAIWVALKAMLKRGAKLTAPAPVVAQIWRTPPHPETARVLRACEVDALGAPNARAVGALIGRSRTRDIVDGAVVVGAIARGDAIVTSDPGDIRRLLGAAGVTLEVIEV